jgi:hypothetical protein
MILIHTYCGTCDTGIMIHDTVHCKIYIFWRCDYRTHVLTISYIDLVIFAHVAQA